MWCYVVPNNISNEWELGITGGYQWLLWHIYDEFKVKEYDLMFVECQQTKTLFKVFDDTKWTRDCF